MNNERAQTKSRRTLNFCLDESQRKLYCFLLTRVKILHACPYNKDMSFEHTGGVNVKFIYI